MISDILIGTLIPLWLMFAICLVNWLVLNNNLAINLNVKKYYVTRVGNLALLFGFCIVLFTFGLILTKV